MSGGIITKTETMRKLSALLCSACVLMLSASGLEAATAVQPVAKAATTAAKTTATATPTKTATPPKQVATAAKTVVAKTSSSLVQQKAPAKPEQKKKVKKIVKVRKQVVDAKIAVWGRTAEQAEALAMEAARKLVGSKDNYLIKDTLFIYEAANRVICTLRVNFTDEMPETWYLESEMVTGFGKSYERAFQEALVKAAGKAKIVQNSNDWHAVKSSAKNASELGVVPYDYLFASIGSEKYCKLFFRYMAPR